MKLAVALRTADRTSGSKGAKGEENTQVWVSTTRDQPATSGVPLILFPMLSWDPNAIADGSRTVSIYIYH